MVLRNLKTFPFLRFLALSAKLLPRTFQPRKFILAKLSKYFNRENLFFVYFVEAKQINPTIKGCQSCDFCIVENLHQVLLWTLFEKHWYTWKTLIQELYKDSLFLLSTNHKSFFRAIFKIVSIAKVSIIHELQKICGQVESRKSLPLK